MIADVKFFEGNGITKQQRRVRHEPIKFRIAYPPGGFSNAWSGSAGMNMAVKGAFIVIPVCKPWDMFKFVCNECLKESLRLAFLAAGRGIVLMHAMPSMQQVSKLPAVSGNLCCLSLDGINAVNPSTFLPAWYPQLLWYTLSLSFLAASWKLFKSVSVKSVSCSIKTQLFHVSSALHAVGIPANWLRQFQSTPRSRAGSVAQDMARLPVQSNDQIWHLIIRYPCSAIHIWR